MSVRIETPRFLLRELGISDVTQRYLAWLEDADARRFIVSAGRTRGLAELERYVSERIGRPDVLFLGIFDRSTGSHIGNIKYEPLDSEGGYAIMGILIGEADYRGKGVTTEVLRASGEWLRRERSIREIVLGVDRENAGAVRAYEKVGFVASETPHIPKSDPGVMTMVWRP